MVNLDAVAARMQGDKKPPPPMASLLILDDGRRGSLNRCLGVAKALGFADPEVLELRAKWQTRLLDWLPVPWVFGKLPATPYPDVVMAAGARGSRVLRWLKRQSPNVFTVQLMRPAGNFKDYDVVVMETHDTPPKRDNICVTTGAVNHINRDELAKEGQRWAARLRACTDPALAVMVGGGNKHRAFTAADAKRLAEELLAGARENGMSLLVTTSRRTGEAATNVLEKILTKQDKVPVYFWQPNDPLARDNPYFAYLEKAAAVVVTGDSISMVSEAATAGKPVYVWTGDAKLPRKFAQFLETMNQQGRVRLWGGRLNLRPPAAPLMDTVMAAGFIRARWRQFKGGKIKGV